METLLVNDENKTVANFIKRLLQSYKGVRGVDFAPEKMKQQMLDDLEMEQDVFAYDNAKKMSSDATPFDAALEEWKQKGMI